MGDPIEEATAKINQLPEEARISRALLTELRDAAARDGQLDEQAAIGALINAVIRLESALHTVIRGG